MDHDLQSTSLAGPAVVIPEVFIAVSPAIPAVEPQSALASSSSAPELDLFSAPTLNRPPLGQATLAATQCIVCYAHKANLVV